MRRLIVFFLFPMLFLQGCSVPVAAAKPAPPVFSFTAEAVCVLGEKQQSGTVERASASQFRYVLSPSELPAGLEYVWDSAGFHLGYQGLVSQNASCPLPKISFARLLKDVLDGASQVDALTSAGGGVYTGMLEQAEYRLVTDAKTGYIQEISLPEQGFIVRFSGFTAWQEPQRQPSMVSSVKRL